MSYCTPHENADGSEPFGKQWNDKVTLPDGRTLTEEQYLKEQGKIPLKNN